MDKDKIRLIESEPKYTDDFLELWAIYPRKEGKKPAENIYNRLRRTYTKEQLLKATIEYIEEKEGSEKQYIKQGVSFLSARIHDYLNKTETKILVYSKEVDLYEQLLTELKRMGYSDYLNTEHWKHFRDEVFKFYGHKCQVCNGIDKLHVHHKTYENRGRETFNDVILICDLCHAKIHGKQ